MTVAPAPSEAESPTQRVGRVLLVEDNTINQLVASEMLHLLGVSVDCANDGAEALDMVARQRYDLIFMDIQMPGMDGLEATREIRRLQAEGGHAPTPIVALTANAAPRDRELCLAAGMDDFLAKPVQTDQLAAVLSRFPPPTPR